jgi:hypothetical protein
MLEMLANTYVASIEATTDAAERIAAALETADTPAAMAVTLFDQGTGKSRCRLIIPRSPIART